MCTDTAYENPLKAAWDWEIPLFLPLAFASVRPRFFGSSVCECTRRADVLRRDDSPAVQEPESAPCVEFATRSWSFTYTCNDLYRIYSSMPSWAGRIRRDVWLTVHFLDKAKKCEQTASNMPKKKRRHHLYQSLEWKQVLTWFLWHFCSHSNTGGRSDHNLRAELVWAASPSELRHFWWVYFYASGNLNLLFLYYLFSGPVSWNFRHKPWYEATTALY